MNLEETKSREDFLAQVAKHIPPATSAETEKALRRGVKRSVELGWCQTQNAGSSIEESALIRKLIASGEIKLRIYNAVAGTGEPAERLLKEGTEITDRFTQRTIKCYADGALGSRGAALLEKYADADTSGFLKNKEGDLEPLFERALRAGLQIETHAIGDRANRIVLDLYEAAMKAVPEKERKVAEPRWRIEHAQILSRPTSRASRSWVSFLPSNPHTRSATSSSHQAASDRNGSPGPTPGRV